jgi:hypothetical protein
MIDRKKILEDIKNGEYSFFDAQEEIKNDKEIVIEVVKSDRYDFKYVSDNLKNDKEVALLAVESTGDNLKYVSDRLKNDREIVLEAVKYSGKALLYASENRKADEDIVLLSSLSSEGTSLLYADKSLFKNYNFLKSAINSIVLYDDMTVRRFHVLRYIIQNSNLFYGVKPFRKSRYLGVIFWIEDFLNKLNEDLNLRYLLFIFFGFLIIFISCIILGSIIFNIPLNNYDQFISGVRQQNSISFSFYFIISCFFGTVMPFPMGSLLDFIFFAFIPKRILKKRLELV